MQCSDGSLTACLARHAVQRPAARRPPSPGNRAGCTAAALAARHKPQPATIAPPGSKRSRLVNCAY
ncbi:hypothetical protein XAR_0347 [Xanthomonas citri pv. glycines str. 8ra]|nr:hypothetical protein XAR_0347 [Xanthomonas citri pv. glycines str. 8ra]